MAAWIATGLAFFVLVLIFTQALTRLFPGLVVMAMAGWGYHDRAERDVNDYRRRLDVVFLGLVLSVLGHTLNVIAFYLMGKMLFPTTMTTTLAQHFLMVPLTLFTMVVPLPFGGSG